LPQARLPKGRFKRDEKSGNDYNYNYKLFVESVSRFDRGGGDIDGFCGWKLDPVGSGSWNVWHFPEWDGSKDKFIFTKNTKVIKSKDMGKVCWRNAIKPKMILFSNVDKLYAFLSIGHG